jgi:hypothetical protein
MAGAHERLLDMEIDEVLQLATNEDESGKDESQ